MTKEYKYTRIKRNHELSDYEMNEFGRNGWSLCSMLLCGGQFLYIFKKEVSENDTEDTFVRKKYIYDNGKTKCYTISDFRDNKMISSRLNTVFRSQGIHNVDELMSNRDILESNTIRGFGEGTRKEMDEIISHIKEDLQLEDNSL